MTNQIMGGYQSNLVKLPGTGTMLYDWNVYKEYSCTRILLKLSLGWTLWRSQGSMFTEKYCTNLGTCKKIMNICGQH